MADRRWSIYRPATQKEMQRQYDNMRFGSWNTSAYTDDPMWKMPTLEEWSANPRNRLTSIKTTDKRRTLERMLAEDPSYTARKWYTKDGGIGGALDSAFDQFGKMTGDLIDEPGIQALLLAGGAGAGMGMYGAGEAAGTSIGASAAPGEALYSTVAEPSIFGGGAMSSTPAMTTYAGPTGSALGGTTGAATVNAAGTGLAGGALAGGAMANSVSAPVTNATLNATPIDAVGASAFDEAGMTAMGEVGGSAPLANATTSGAAYTGTGPGLSTMEEAAMLGIGDAPLSGAAMSMPSLSTIMSSPLTYQMGGSLYQMYQANEAKDAYEQMLNEMNSGSYDYRQNDDLVQEYLRNPMGLLQKHPGYQASVDFLTKQGQRQMAAKGYSGSGNIGYYLADTLGKNAADWHEKLWNPIAQSAGLANYPNRAAMGQVGVNAMSQIENAKRNAGGEIFSAASRHLPDIFKNWTTS